jgi:citrate lyase gamma subunit
VGATREIEPAVALRVRPYEEPGIEVRINFGVFAGRTATPAEIDKLAGRVSAFVPAFAIVSEERHEFGGAVEASVHQVVVEVAREHADPEADVLAERIVLEANGWALDCIESRHADV